MTIKFALPLLLLAHMICAVPFIGVQPGVAEVGTLQDTTQTLYYKIDFTSEPQGSNLKIILSSCKNAINVYGKICDPVTSGGACLDDNYIPSPQNNDFSLLFDAEKNPAGELPLTGNFFCPQQQACTAQRVYYLALVAATSATTTTTTLYARSYRPTDAAPMQFANDIKLQFEPHSGVLSWQPLATCKEYDKSTPAQCKQLEPIANARYRVIYTALNDSCNVASVCGHRCSQMLEWTSNTVITLPFFGEREYAYRIGMYSDSASYPLEAQQSYMPLVATKKQHNDAGNIVLQVIMIIAFVLLALFMVVSAVAIVIVAIFYIRKTQSTYEVVN